MTRVILAVLTALTMGSMGVAAQGQTMPWISPNIISTTTGTDVTSVVLNGDRGGNDGDRGSVTGPANSFVAPGGGASAGVVADYTFRYDRKRTQTNLQSFLARTSDPAARADLERMITAQPTLMDDIAAGVRGYGLDPHNVADAYAVWWINVWGASQKRNIEPDAETVAAVKQQVRNAFSATSDFAKAGDADRQEYAEALLLQATLLGSAFEQWKNDPAMLDQLAEAARKGAQASGLNLSLMTLTPNGFVPRKGADASGAMVDEGGTIHNARIDAPAQEGEGFGIGLALAAGTGLGATLLAGYALLRRG